MNAKLLLACCLFSTTPFVCMSQDLVKLSQKTMPIAYQKGRFMGGVGATFFGLTAKAGGFVQNRLWIGAEGELHEFLSSRKEAGLFARYYPWNGQLTTFVETGISYGQFGYWNFDIDNEYPDPWGGKSAKVNVGMGIEYRINNRFGIEILAKVGKLTATNWIQPSFQGSVNISFGK